MTSLYCNATRKWQHLWYNEPTFKTICCLALIFCASINCLLQLRFTLSLLKWTRSCIWRLSLSLLQPARNVICKKGGPRPDPAHLGIFFSPKPCPNLRVRLGLSGRPTRWELYFWSFRWSPIKKFPMVPCYILIATKCFSQWYTFGFSFKKDLSIWVCFSKIFPTYIWIEAENLTRTSVHYSGCRRSICPGLPTTTASTRPPSSLRVFTDCGRLHKIF